ncbi:hypothetical protein DFH11DRAFT_1182638 [Phellopilus nigrolimitatus]|nr:hypothetical protein DFH11DRAFT_1182638 [Phellopilus nigrolimitatus]
MDVYCRKAISEALSTTRFARTPDFAQLTETQQVQNFVENCGPQSFYRHSDADGKLIHMRDSSSVTELVQAKKIHRLEIGTESMLRLRVQRGEAFSSVGHYPIVAGRTANGKIAYLADAFYSRPYFHRYCTVTEGMKPENLRLEVRNWKTGRSRMRTSEAFAVYVLRYESAAYARTRDWYEYKARGLDPTGPFFWRPVEDLRICTTTKCS